MEDLSLRPKFDDSKGEIQPQVSAAIVPPVRIVNGRFRSLYVTLDEDTALKLDKAVLYGKVGAYEDALALIASIPPELQCSAVISVERSLLLWNQRKYLQAAEILRKAIAFAQSEGKDVRTHGIYTLIRLLLGNAEYNTEGDFTSARDSMQETRLWLQSVAIEKLDDVQTYSLYRYYLLMRIASHMLGFKSDHFTVIPHVEEAAEGSRLSNLRQYLQSQGRLSEGYIILGIEINRFSDEITKQDSIQSFLSCCSPLDSEPVWFVEGSARLLLASSLRRLGKNDQADEQFRKSRILFQKAPVPERLNDLELEVRLQELSHTMGDLRIRLNNWIRFLEDDSARLDDAKRSEALENIVNTTEEILKSPGNLEIRGIFWKFYNQLETLHERNRRLTSLHIYRLTADRVAFLSTEYGAILLWHDKFHIKYPRFNSSLHLKSALRGRLMIYNKMRDVDGCFATLKQFNDLVRQGTEFWSKAYENRNDLSTFVGLQKSDPGGIQTTTGSAPTNPDQPGTRFWHSEWMWDVPVVYDTGRRLTPRLTDREWRGGPQVPLGYFTLGSQNLSVSTKYGTLLRWLREAIESQEISQEELEQILLSDTESSAEVNIQTLLQETTPGELVTRFSSLSTARWTGTSEILSNWLLKKSKHMEVQRHFLLAFLLNQRLAVCSVEAKVVEAKRLLDLMPQLNQIAVQSFTINNSDLRNELAVSLKHLLTKQGSPCPLFDETSGKFLEILGLFELSLQENRAKGSLIGECLTLKFIASLYFYPASKVQSSAPQRFFDYFYAAEATAQTLNQAWAVLPGRSKVQKVLLSAERVHQVDVANEGIAICLKYPQSIQRVGIYHIWALVQVMKSRGFGWLMHADALTGKETDVRSFEGTSPPKYVPLIDLDDLRLIASDSCSDVVFVDWYGEAGSIPTFLITCHQGYRPDIWATTKSWKEVEDTIDKFTSLEEDDLMGQEADKLLEQLQPLVQPLANATKPGQTLVFCPAGNLHRIPLHALKLDGDVLIQRNPVIYCSSLAALKATFRSRKRHESRGDGPSQESRDLEKCWKASLFGQPPSAPGIRALQSLGNKLKVQPYTGDSFTTSNFRSEVSSGLDLLHFHSHADFNEKDPLKQCLIFDDDEPFTIDDIYDLSPAPRPYHATLLACGSGMSKANLSNDVVGLVPAFLYSGAASTVSTLWKFDDADAALFSDHFYSTFDGSLGGEEGIRIDLAKALQAAVLAIRERSPALYHWAPFVLHGYWMFEVGSRKKALDQEHRRASMNNLALVMGSQGKYEEAEGMHRKELEMRRKALGPEHLDTLTSMSNLALVLSSQGKYVEAEQMHRRALELRQKVLGLEHPDTLASMGHLGWALSSQGKYVKAEQMHQQELEMKRRVLGLEHPDTLTSMSHLGYTLSGLGKYVEAVQMHRQELEMGQRVLGLEHPHVLESMGCLGAALIGQGKYVEAEQIQRQTLELKQKVLGPEHPHTLVSMSQLASALSSEGKYVEAEQMHQQTLKLSQKVSGLEHPDTLTSMNNLGWVLHNKAKYAEAEQMHRQTLELRQKVSGLEHPDTLASMGNLGWALSSQGKYIEAEQVHRQELEMRQRVLGLEHPLTLTSMGQLAWALSGQGKHVEAEQMHRRALEFRQKVSGLEHPDTLTSMNNLGLGLNNQGKYVEAEQIYKQTLELRQKVLGLEHPDTLTCMSHLGCTLSSQGKYVEAEQMHRQELEMRQRVLGLEHAHTLANIGLLAAALGSQGKYVEAEQMYRQILELRTKVLGLEHPDTLMSMDHLGSVLNSQGKYVEAEQMHRRALELRQKDPLPEGWEERKNQEGQVYFVDHNTKSTTWVRPGLGEAAGMLPEGWEERKNQEGQVYFVDHNTKSTTWVRPGLGEAAGMLPEGWEARQTREGKLYFVNHITKSTSWIHPLQKMR